MNQIAAAILVLSASITGYAAATRPAGDNYGLMMTLVALGLGLWGALALLTSTVHDGEYELEDGGFGSVTRRVMPPANLLNRTTQRYATVPVRSSGAEDYGYGTDSQMHMRARTRTSLADEAMRHDLQRYSSGRVA